MVVHAPQGVNERSTRFLMNISLTEDSLILPHLRKYASYDTAPGPHTQIAGQLRSPPTKSWQRALLDCIVDLTINGNQRGTFDPLNH